MASRCRQQRRHTRRPEDKQTTGDPRRKNSQKAEALGTRTFGRRPMRYRPIGTAMMRKIHPAAPRPPQGNGTKRTASGQPGRSNRARRGCGTGAGTSRPATRATRTRRPSSGSGTSDPAVGSTAISPTDQQTHGTPLSPKRRPENAANPLFCPVSLAQAGNLLNGPGPGRSVAASLASVIIPAATVPMGCLVDEDKPPVVRLRESSSTISGTVVRSRTGRSR